MNSSPKPYRRLAAAGWLAIRLFPKIALIKASIFFRGSYSVVSPHSTFRCSVIQPVGLFAFVYIPHLHGVPPIWLISFNTFV